MPTPANRYLATPARHTNWVIQGAFSPDGTRFLTASLDGRACVWDATSGIRLAELTHKGPVIRAVFTPDGQRILTASGDETDPWAGYQISKGPVRIRSWQATTGEPLGPELTLPYSNGTAEFSHDTRQVVTCCPDDRSWRTWDTATGKPLTPSIDAGGQIECARFSPNDRRLLLATYTALGNDKAGADTSSIGECRVWDCNRAPVTPPWRHKLEVSVASFSPDGRRVVTASRDDTARVWDATTGTPVTPLLVHHWHVIDATSARTEGWS